MRSRGAVEEVDNHINMKPVNERLRKHQRKQREVERMMESAFVTESNGAQMLTSPTLLLSSIGVLSRMIKLFAEKRFEAGRCRGCVGICVLMACGHNIRHC